MLRPIAQGGRHLAMLTQKPPRCLAVEPTHTARGGSRRRMLRSTCVPRVRLARAIYRWWRATHRRCLFPSTNIETKRRNINRTQEKHSPSKGTRQNDKTMPHTPKQGKTKTRTHRGVGSLYESRLGLPTTPPRPPRPTLGNIIGTAVSDALFFRWFRMLRSFVRAAAMPMTFNGKKQRNNKTSSSSYCALLEL